MANIDIHDDTSNNDGANTLDPNNKTDASSTLLQEPPTSENDIPRNENSISLETQRPITTEKNSASTKLGLCLPVSQSENPSPKKRSKSSRRCRFSGCNNSEEGGCKILQKACIFHYDMIRAKNNNQRKILYQKSVTITNSIPTLFDFSSAPSRLVSIHSDISFYSDILLHASQIKGEMIGMMYTAKSHYNALNKHGYAFLPNSIEIKDSDYDSLLSEIEGSNSDGVEPWSFDEKLFTSFTNDNLHAFITGETPNRFISSLQSHIDYIKQWISLDEKLLSVLKNCGFPKRKRKDHEFLFDYSILKSDPCLVKCQQAHIGVDKQFSHKLNQPFSFHVFIGIERYGFLDILLDSKDDLPRRVLIERGDILLLRSDIPRCDCENLINRKHYRLEAFCSHTIGDGFDSTPIPNNFPVGTHYDFDTNRFNRGSRK